MKTGRYQDAARLCGSYPMGSVAARVVAILPKTEPEALSAREISEAVGLKSIKATQIENLRFEVAAARAGKIRTTGSQPRRFYFQPPPQK